MLFYFPQTCLPRGRLRRCRRLSIPACRQRSLHRFKKLITTYLNFQYENKGLFPRKPVCREADVVDESAQIRGICGRYSTSIEKIPYYLIFHAEDCSAG